MGQCQRISRWSRSSSVKRWKNCIAFRGNASHSYGASPAIWEHTPATRHRWTCFALTPAKQASTRCIATPERRKAELSWPGLFAIYPDGLPVRRQSPMQVVTGTGVEQLYWLRPARLPLSRFDLYSRSWRQDRVWERDLFFPSRLWSLGSVVSSFSGICGGTPAANDFNAFLT